MMASTQQHSLVRLAVAALHTKQSARNPMRLEQHCPPRDEQFSGERHDHGGLARALRALSPCPIPLCEHTVLLEPEKPPGELDQTAAQARVARFGKRLLPSL